MLIAHLRFNALRSLIGLGVRTRNLGQWMFDLHFGAIFQLSLINGDCCAVFGDFGSFSGCVVVVVGRQRGGVYANG